MTPQHNYPTHRNVVVETLTPSRMEVLKAVHEFITAHEYSPALREVTAALGRQSHSSVKVNLLRLKKDGYLFYACDARGLMITRTLRLTKKGLAQVNPAPNNQEA